MNQGERTRWKVDLELAKKNFGADENNQGERELLRVHNWRVVVVAAVSGYISNLFAAPKQLHGHLRAWGRRCVCEEIVVVVSGIDGWMGR